MGKARKGVLSLIGMLHSGNTSLPDVPMDKDIHALEIAIKDAVRRAATGAVHAERIRVERAIRNVAPDTPAEFATPEHQHVHDAVKDLALRLIAEGNVTPHRYSCVVGRVAPHGTVAIRDSLLEQIEGDPKERERLTPAR